ncbi:MAG TPA: ATP-binding protein [Myxococcaceae bacterium]|nr:ATP-binding protein [Myxococcaceae bacterium]
MKLRTQLLLAQGPLALVLALVGAVEVFTLGELVHSGQNILKDNFRSVLAAQRMKEALERIDSAAMFLVIGERERGLRQAAQYRPKFEEELRVQEANITEPGEAEATARLRELWTQYQLQFDDFKEHTENRWLRNEYLSRLNPSFVAVKDAADVILDLNQDAMVRKSEALRRRGEQVRQLTILGVFAAFVIGLWFSSALTARALRPVSILSQAVRRLGQGDLEARARVAEGGEIGQLAEDFNAMADRLKGYRESSLGELLQAQQASQAAIDSLPDPVIVFGAQGGILNINQSAESVLGFSLETPGDPLARVPPEMREVLDRARGHVLSGKGAYLPRGYEEAVRVDLPDGARFFLPRASPVYAETAGITAATVILQDVTRLRRFDELKNDLVATVAHEFRTPLTSLRMAIHLIAEEVVGPLTEKQAGLLSAARQDCERLQGIVDDLLDLSSIQSGRLELQVRSISATELLSKAIASQEFPADQKNIRLESSIAADLDQLELDPDRIGLVLNNLISNAIRHTPEGGRVSIHVLRSSGSTRFEVTDNGEGIAPEYHKRVFEKFFRVPGTAAGGAGLGLSISREIVEAHGGEIGVESRPGHGSTFWFTVPRGRAPV